MRIITNAYENLTEITNSYENFVGICNICSAIFVYSRICKHKRTPLRPRRLSNDKKLSFLYDKQVKLLKLLILSPVTQSC